MQMDTKTMAQVVIDKTQGLGASEVAAAIGASRHTTPMQLYMKKKGQMPEKQSELFEHGHGLERYILNQFADKIERDLYAFQTTFVHPVLTWLYATPDALVDVRVPVDAKNVGQYNRGLWNLPGDAMVVELSAHTDLPADYYWQAQQQAYVLEADHAYMVPFFGGNEHRIMRIPRNDAHIAEIMIPRVEYFMEALVNDRMPEPINDDDIKLLYPTSVQQVIEANDEIKNIIQAHAEMKAAQKDSPEGKKLKELELSIKKYIGDKEAIVDSDGTTLLSFKSESRGIRLDTKRFKEAHPDLFKEFSDAQTARVLRNKLK